MPVIDGRWTLVGSGNRTWQSPKPGALGGHRRSRIYGRLDCRTALAAIARGGYVAHRVFFLNAAHARASGYRPCAVCLPVDYARWKRAAGAGVLQAASVRLLPGSPTGRPRPQEVS